MLRGFIELYQIDHNKTYLTDFQKSLDYAWHHARDERGLFHTDWSGTDKTRKMALDTSCFHRNVWKTRRNRFAIITFNNPIKTIEI